MRVLLLPSVLLLTSCNSPVVMRTFLAIINISPSGGAVNVDTEANVIATFSEPLDPATVATTSAYLADADNNLVVSSVTYDEELLSITLDPEDSLDNLSTYTVVLTNGIVGLESGPLAASVSSTFTTYGSSPVNAVPIANAGENLEGILNGLVRFDGSESYDPEGNLLTYAWRIVTAPATSVATIDGDTDANPALVPDVVGTYILGLVVNDGVYDSSEDFIQLTVTEPTPDDTGSDEDTGIDLGPIDSGASDTGPSDTGT